MSVPRISSLRNDPNDSDILLFTLSDVNVSIANAMRRILLSEIKTPCFKSESEEELYKCVIEKNNTRFTNEVIKQRLACVPIHIRDSKINVENYVLELDVSNKTKDVMYVTTHDFKLKNKETGKLIKDEVVNKIFPSSPKTGDYIEFLRLMPATSTSHRGEEIKLSCPLTYGIAMDSACFNVVSTVSYSNTMDDEKASLVWKREEEKLINEEQMDDERIMLAKKNWYLLEAKRYFKANSYDFKIKSIGVFENEELLNKSILVLKEKLDKTASSLKSNDKSVIEIKKALSETPETFDVVLYGEDYTLGKVLEFYLYEQYYEKQTILGFVGFRKDHPSDTHSYIRVSFNEPSSKEALGKYVVSICDYANALIEKIKF